MTMMIRIAAIFFCAILLFGTLCPLGCSSENDDPGVPPEEQEAAGDAESATPETGEKFNLYIITGISALILAVAIVIYLCVPDKIRLVD